MKYWYCLGTHLAFLKVRSGKVVTLVSLRLLAGVLDNHCILRPSCHARFAVHPPNPTNNILTSFIPVAHRHTHAPVQIQVTDVDVSLAAHTHVYVTFTLDERVYHYLCIYEHIHNQPTRFNIRNVNVKTCLTLYKEQILLWIEI